MSKLIVWRIDPGDFEQGFPSFLQIGEEGQPPIAQWQGMIPPAPELPELYQAWQSMYYHLGKSRWGLRITVPPHQITNVSNAYSCEQLADRFTSQLQQWLAQPAFQSLNLEILDKVSAQESVRVILQTDNALLKRFPWHLWSLFDRRPQAELALYTAAHEQSIAMPLEAPVKVLAVLGHDEGLDLQADWQSISQLPHTQITLLDQPSLQEINEYLWKQPWDILFFAGHSMGEAGLDPIETANLSKPSNSTSEQSNRVRGKLRLNQESNPSIHQLQYALTHAVSQGLKLAMFNSCDGLSLTSVLEDARVPQVIVMREPVPDRVAQTFLRYLLEDFAAGNPWHLAMRQAREKLQWMENEFPCATWLPVMCQSPAIVPQSWPRTGIYPEPNPHRPQVILPRKVQAQRSQSGLYPSHPQITQTSHCINPHCHAPGPHPWTMEKCPTCNTSLRLNDRLIPLALEESCRGLDRFKAYDRKTKTIVDLQVYYALDEAAIADLKQETAILKTIHQAHLPNAHLPIVIDDVFLLKSNGFPLTCRALTSLPGTTLHELLNTPQYFDSRREVHQVLQWLQQAIQTVAILHEHQLVHGNLTPKSWVAQPIQNANLSSLQWSSLKWNLIGFGDLRGGQIRLRKTQKQTEQGSAYYPRQQNRSAAQAWQSLRPSMDCYALGMIAIQGLTGNHPSLYVDSQTGFVNWVAGLRSVSPNRAANIPQALIQLINQMVHPDPKVRPHSAQVLVPIVQSIQIKPSLIPSQLKLAFSPIFLFNRFSPQIQPQSSQHSSMKSSTNYISPRSAQRNSVLSHSFLAVGDGIIHAFRHVLLAFCYGAIASAMSGGLFLWLFFESPVHLILKQALNGFQLSPALGVFAVSGAITAWVISTTQDESSESRLWLMGLLLAIGYVGLWKILPHYNSVQTLLSLGLLLALFTVLNTGNYRNLWLKMILTVSGSLGTIWIWRHSKLWRSGDLLLMLQGHWKNGLSTHFLDENLIILAGLGGCVALWFSLSLVITQKLMVRSKTAQPEYARR